MDWAYFNLGRLKENGISYWAKPFDNSENKIMQIFPMIWNDLQENGHSRDDVVSIIGFNGDNWFSGGFAKTGLLLDESIKDIEYYSTDDGGRITSFLHGFISKGKDFPEQIPHLNDDELKRINNDLIVPIWGIEDYDKIGAVGDKIDEIIKTNFGQPEQLKNIHNVLPENMVAKIQDSAARGTPIFLRKNGEHGQWEDITNAQYFQIAMKKYKQEDVNQSAGFLQSLYDDGKLTDKGKIAAGAAFLATIAIGYGIYSWCNREKPETKLETATIQVSQDKNELKQTARAH
jgi:hypothetical protein